MSRKPWEEYPEIWKTEAAFWTYVRGGLRRGLWEKSPIKLSYKNNNVGKPPEGYTGRAKTGTECALTGEWTGKSKLEVDHMDGHKSLLCWGDVLEFILHLIPPPDSLQLVDKEAHKIKSYAERKGISFEEAVIEKKAIAICKGDEKKWLLDNGMDSGSIGSNVVKRRHQVKDLLTLRERL